MSSSRGNKTDKTVPSYSAHRAVVKRGVMTCIVVDPRRVTSVTHHTTWPREGFLQGANAQRGLGAYTKTGNESIVVVDQRAGEPHDGVVHEKGCWIPPGLVRHFTSPALTLPPPTPSTPASLARLPITPDQSRSRHSHPHAVATAVSQGSLRQTSPKGQRATRE